MDNNERLEYAYSLVKKYRGLPRTGWVKSGSRAKSNHAVTVPREEIVNLADDFHTAIFIQIILLHENSNLIHFLEQIAEGEPDIQECPKCFKKYRKSWMSGKCIYCEAKYAAASTVKKFMEKKETDSQAN